MCVTDQSVSKGIFLTRVLSNQPICREHWRLVLEVKNFPAAEPGQFIQIQCAEPDNAERVSEPLLRRPFSIGGLLRRAQRCELDILYRVVGIGTGWLSQRTPGQAVSIIGPLGHPFTISRDRPVAFLVAGGIGSAPLIWLAEALSRAGKNVIAFCGAKTADLLPLTRSKEVEVSKQRPTLAFEEFARFDVPVLMSTDDGSLGSAGTISEIFSQYLRDHQDPARPVEVYTCGPNLMMRAVAEFCAQHSTPCQVCLEQMMACGLGTCQSCVVRIRDENNKEQWQYRLCCTDGPVFDSRLVVWDD